MTPEQTIKGLTRTIEAFQLDLKVATKALEASLAREEQLKILLSHARRKADRFENKARCLNKEVRNG